MLRDADPGQRELWEKVTGIYRRKMEFYDSEAVSPVVTTHPDLEFTGLPEDRLAEFHDTLTAALHDPRHLYAHDWRTGDLVVADNYTLLHGREAFTTRSPRHLQRVHVLGEPALDNPALVR